MGREKRAVFSWWLYDWANSAFILTVATAFFPVIFKQYWCIGVDATVSTARLGIGNAIAGMVTALFAPVLGVLADYSNTKKKLLVFFVGTGALCTMLLSTCAHGVWLCALPLFLIASIGFNNSNIMYDALLVDVAEKERMDWVSSVGYSIGYLGSGLLFIVNVIMVNKPTAFGIDGPVQAIKIAFIITGIWWIVFTIPLFLFVKEKKYGLSLSFTALLKTSISHIVSIASSIIHQRKMFLFLIGYWFYIDGVHTFVLMAIDFGMAIGLSTSSLMTTLIIVQLVGIPCAFLFGLSSKWLGTYRMILIGIGIYLLVCIYGALFLHSERGFLILGILTAVAQGGIQALSRSCFGKMIPQDKAAEYFGFFNIVNRFSVIAGPMIVGVVALTTRKAGVTSVIASRVGMGSLSLFFIVGGLIILAVMNVEKRGG